MKTIAAGVCLTALLMTAISAQAECDFDKPAGGCTGRIEILSSGGKKPSYSAEARVTSSAGACSKVEFYVNSTPYTSIIRTDGIENESFSSSSPIKKSDIKISKCTAYSSVGDADAQKRAQAAADKVFEDAMACMRRHQAYMKQQQAAGKSFMGLMQYCP